MKPVEDKSYMYTLDVLQQNDLLDHVEIREQCSCIY